MTNYQNLRISQRTIIENHALNEPGVSKHFIEEGCKNHITTFDLK